MSSDNEKIDEHYEKEKNSKKDFFSIQNSLNLNKFEVDSIIYKTS